VAIKRTLQISALRFLVHLLFFKLLTLFPPPSPKVTIINVKPTPDHYSAETLTS